MSELPYLITFPKIGDELNGFISVSEKHNLPFKPKRIYWTYYTPWNLIRGNHAHHKLEQILIAVSGKIELNIELLNGEKYNFILESPNLGVFIPRMSWRTMKYFENTVQLCIASMEYSESDYVRDYHEFKSLR
jgi:hypothetical protein